MSSAKNALPHIAGGASGAPCRRGDWRTLPAGRVAYLFVPDVYVIGLKGHLIAGQAAYIFVTDEEYAEKLS